MSHADTPPSGTSALGWRGAGDPCLQVLARRRQRSQAAPRVPEGILGDDRERGVVGPACYCGAFDLLQTTIN